jgi:uncharacterized membrane protein
LYALQYVEHHFQRSLRTSALVTDHASPISSLSPVPAVWPNRILLILSLAGIGVSLYLTLAHLRAVDLGCGRLSGCHEVDQHWSASGLGIPGLQAIPTAAFGLAMYVTMTVLSFARAATPLPDRDRKIAGLQWIIALAALGVTAWLTYMEAFVIKAWCQWCLVSAGIILLMFITSTLERCTRGAPLKSSSIETQGEPV